MPPTEREATLGIVCSLLFAAVVGLGVMVYMQAAGSAPQPLPPCPAPCPTPHACPHCSAAWYQPPAAVDRYLPKPPPDGFPRNRAYWRWEINARGEYRYRYLGYGEAPPLGQMPGSAPPALPSSPFPLGSKPPEKN